MPSSKSSPQKKPQDEGRVPPHSDEMERALLCSCLIDGECFIKVVDLVSTKDFYDHRHVMIWSAMIDLHTTGSPIDILTVCDHLERLGTLERLGGQAYIVELSMSITTSVYVVDYAKRVRGYSQIRQVILENKDAIEKAYDIPHDIDEFINQHSTNILSIGSFSTSSDVVPISIVLPQMMEVVDRNSKRIGGVTVGLSTGFGDIDDMTGGFQDGDLIVIAARPSMGKTSLAVDCMRHQAGNKIPIAFFSLEMSKISIATRILSAESSINLQRLRLGKLSDVDWKRLTLTYPKVMEFPLYIDDKGSMTVSEIMSKSTRLIREKNIKAIYVDYLQLLTPGRASTRTEEIAKMTRPLKNFARDNNMPVILLSQLSRDVEKRGGDKIPQLSDLRDGGAIEQDADVVAFIHRKKAYKTGDDADRTDNIADIIIRKQRNGPTGTVKLIFNDIYARFDNLEHSPQGETKLAGHHYEGSDVPEEAENPEDLPF